VHGESDGCEVRSIEGGGGSPGVARTEKARSLGTRVWHQQDGSRPLDRWVVAKYRRGAIEDGSPEAAIVKKAAKLRLMIRVWRTAVVDDVVCLKRLVNLGNVSARGPLAPRLGKPSSLVDSGGAQTTENFPSWAPL